MVTQGSLNPNRRRKNFALLSAENIQDCPTIHQAMSPEEIAEIVSDRVISEVKRQFQETREKLQREKLPQ